MALDERWLPDHTVKVHVDPSAPPGGDGTSWATAFSNLRTALESATAEALRLTERWELLETRKAASGSW